MFVLAVVEDKLKTLPEQFARDSRDVLMEQIDKKYVSSVVCASQCISVCLCTPLSPALPLTPHIISTTTN